jgi:hypothetical protein
LAEQKPWRIMALDTGVPQRGIAGVGLMRGGTMRRFSIRNLMAFIIVAQISLAAIRIRSAPWSEAMSSITFFTMVCSLLGVAFRRGLRQIYWSGFAALGWSYLLRMYAPWLDLKVGRNLLAPKLFTYLADGLDSDTQAGGGLQSVPIGAFSAAATGGAFGEGFGGAGGRNVPDFIRIGVSIEALLLAFLGGWVACCFASGNREGSHAQAAGASSAIAG